MSRLGIFAYGLAVAGIALLIGREVIHASVFVYQRLASNTAALWVIGWSISTFGPLALSVWFWRLALGSGRQWIWHLLFIPCAIAIFRAGASMLFFAAGVPDGDSIEGHSLVAAAGFLFLTLLIHAAALAALGVARLSRKKGAH